MRAPRRPASARWPPPRLRSCGGRSSLAVVARRLRHRRRRHRSPRPSPTGHRAPRLAGHGPGARPPAAARARLLVVATGGSLRAPRARPAVPGATRGGPSRCRRSSGARRLRSLAATAVARRRGRRRADVGRGPGASGAAPAWRPGGRSRPRPAHCRARPRRDVERRRRDGSSLLAGEPGSGVRRTDRRRACRATDVPRRSSFPSRPTAPASRPSPDGSVALVGRDASTGRRSRRVAAGGTFVTTPAAAGRSWPAATSSRSSATTPSSSGAPSASAGRPPGEPLPLGRGRPGGGGGRRIAGDRGAVARRAPRRGGRPAASTSWPGRFVLAPGGASSRRSRERDDTPDVRWGPGGAGAEPGAAARQRSGGAGRGTPETRRARGGRMRRGRRGSARQFAAAVSSTAVKIETCAASGSMSPRIFCRVS